MPPDDALQIADEALFSHLGKRLTDVHRLILRESLLGKPYDNMEGYSRQHFKNEGRELWALLSKALDEKVSKTNFKGALEKRWMLGELAPTPPQLSIYSPKSWVERKAILDEYLPELQGRTRSLWITGISGIGKTTLGECLASQAWESDPSFQWIYLEILEGQNSDFASVATELLAKLGDRDLNPQERNNPEQLAKRLLQKFQSRPYWIQIDSLERLLNSEQPTGFVDPSWVNFLRSFLTESNMVSRLVLTSQIFPAGLIEFSDRYPNTWAEHRLDGLLQVEQQLEFFAKRGVVVKSNNRDILIRIANIYEGHPLFLKVIAEDILNSFAGDVYRYWQVYQLEFEQDARELQATRLGETEYNEALDRKVRERIKKSIEKLPPEALNLLCRSSVFRRPVQKKFWLKMLTNGKPKTALEILQNHHLVESIPALGNISLLRQHNLIRSVALNLLKTDTCKWKQAERQARDLLFSTPIPDTQNMTLRDVGTMFQYIDAFKHHCEVENWTCEDFPELHRFLGVANLERQKFEMGRSIATVLGVPPDENYQTLIEILDMLEFYRENKFKNIKNT
jgi:hypothetical protein